MADTCARCGLPFREGEERYSLGVATVHPSNMACIARLTAVAHAAEIYVDTVLTYGKGDEEFDRLRAALAGEEPRDADL